MRAEYGVNFSRADIPDAAAVFLILDDLKIGGQKLPVSFHMGDEPDDPALAHHLLKHLAHSELAFPVQCAKSFIDEEEIDRPRPGPLDVI